MNEHGSWLAECLDSSAFDDRPRIIDGVPMDDRTRRLFLEIAPKAQVFYMPDNGKILDLAPDVEKALANKLLSEMPAAMNLPFPCVAIEFLQKGGIAGEPWCVKRVQLCEQRSADEWTFVAAEYPVDMPGARWTPAPFAVSGDPFSPDAPWKYIGGLPARAAEYEDLHKELATAGAWVAVRLMMALACRNVRARLESPPERLQRARERRGKRRLFEYRVLELEQPTDHANASRGKHASPALHLRRGHVRRIASGRYAWVNAHMVGAPSAGVVVKSYDATNL